MQHFQPILIVIGVLAIAAVLIHGYILSRKQQVSQAQSNSDIDDLSELGPISHADANVTDIPVVCNNFDSGEDNDKFVVSVETEEHLDESLVVNRQDKAADDEQLPPASETKISEDGLTETLESDDISSEQEEPIVEQEAQDIFIFNVVAKENSEVRGHELLQFFLTAGFRFGDMSIFHRHLHSDGKGPILFSIANMMAPGTFDPEKMKQFSSEGVSFFLTAPNHDIDIKKAFDLMLVAVEQMAEEFDCVVLNAQREPLTEQQFRDYRERLLKYI